MKIPILCSLFFAGIVMGFWAISGEQKVRDDNKQNEGKQSAHVLSVPDTGSAILFFSSALSALVALGVLDHSRNKMG